MFNVELQAARRFTPSMLVQRCADPSKSTSLTSRLGLQACPCVTALATAVPSLSERLHEADLMYRLNGIWTMTGTSAAAELLACLIEARGAPPGCADRLLAALDKQFTKANPGVKGSQLVSALVWANVLLSRGAGANTLLSTAQRSGLRSAFAVRRLPSQPLTAATILCTIRVPVSELCVAY
jgi:hypothetical protein